MENGLQKLLNTDIAMCPVDTGKAILDFRLRNIQSWGANSDWVPLSTKGFNVFLARSETGKSVLFKACAAVCFPNRDEREELLSYGCESGSLELRLQNGTYVRFVISANNIQSTLKIGDAEERVWNTRSIPDEVRDALGWVLDLQNKVLLNLIDADHAKMFIGTTSTYNAQAMKCVTENPVMTEASEELQSWIDNVQAAAVKMEPRIKFVQDELRKIPVRDVAKLEQVLQRVQAIRDAWKAVEDVNAEIPYYEAALRSVPQQPTGNLALATPLYDCFIILKSCQEDLEAIGKHAEDVRNVPRPLNTALLDALANVEQARRNVASDLLGVITAAESMPKAAYPNINIPLGDAVFSALTEFNQLRQSFNAVVQANIQRPKSPQIDCNWALADGLADAQSKYVELKRNFVDYVKTFRDQVTLESELRQSQARVKEMEAELGVCPTCGQRFEA